MRLTIINLWPAGGMMHYASALANALAEQPGLEVTLLVPRHADTGLLAPQVQPAFVDLVLHKGLAHAGSNLLQLVRIDRFIKAIRATRPDVVHLNSSHPWVILTGRWLARTWPLVATVHDLDPHPGENSLRRRLQGRVVLRHATALAVNDAALAARARERCPWRRPDLVVVTPHGTYDCFGAAGAGDQPAPARPTVLFFGRILAYKGLDVLLEAAPRVRAEVPDVRFVIAGEGSLAPYAASLQDDSLVEIRAGYIPENAVGPLFRDATLLALPYTEASWSGVASIAHAFGLPVVASSVGGLPEAVRDGVNGLLIPPGNVDALVEAIVSVLRDPRLLDRLRRGARNTEAQSWNEAAEILGKLYRRLRT
jgi:glycosyltransferase involved in cell wall biosynthesis